MYLFFFQNNIYIPVTRIRKKPNEGIYVRCSYITSLIGIKLDSIDKVRKNQNIPKENILCFLKRNKASINNEKRNRKLRNVLILKKLSEIGKS